MKMQQLICHYYGCEQGFHSVDFLKESPLYLVPAAVASLKTRSGNQSNALWVSWDRGGGELSGYLLTLYNPNGSQQIRKELGSEVTKVVLSGLVPGRLYQAEVLSLSGEMSNRASTLGRTGETCRIPVQSGESSMIL